MDNVNFVSNLRTADNCHKRTLRLLHDISDGVDLALKQQAGYGWQEMGDCIGRSVCAVHYSKAVLYEHFSMRVLC